MKQKRQLDDSPLRLAQIARLKNVSDDYSHLGQDYILSHITTNTSLGNGLKSTCHSQLLFYVSCLLWWSEAATPNAPSARMF